MNIFEAIVLAIIEGLTEFLPVSSTGHMILGSALMGLESTEFVKFFTVAIQLGTILSVVVLYFKRFFQSINFYVKLFVAFLPAAVMGLIFSDYIDALLESPLGVAIALLVGGVILLFVDKWFKNGHIDNSDKITLSTAFKIGLFQCLAMIPGMSRSASTIVGGMAQKLTRKAAAEFSFFLAIPTMVGATAKKLLDFYKEKGKPELSTLFTGEEIQLLLIGNVVGFVVAIIAIKTFINFVTKHGFKVFGIYRILLGAIIIIMIASGQQLSII